jgi:DNA-binding YbaB/EbfC family protein
MKVSNMGDLLKNIGKVRKDIEKVQADLKNRVVEASAGGGLVKVLVNGQQEVLKVTLDPGVLPGGSGDGSGARQPLEMLEDLVLAAVSQGLERSRNLKHEEMQKVTGGLGLNFSDFF